ncbi:MAG: hypothetical protein M3P33_00415 [bacterium]|nr:hypothetical protein [bacterium]
MNTVPQSTRLTITVPKDLIQDVKDATTQRGISSFIVEAIKNEITRRKRENALKRFALLPPASPEISDPVAYINKLREESENRLHREIS